MVYAKYPRNGIAAKNKTERECMRFRRISHLKLQYILLAITHRTRSVEPMGKGKGIALNLINPIPICTLRFNNIYLESETHSFRLELM